MSEELIGAAALTGRFVVGFIFLTTAIPKLLSASEFERAVRNYDLLPGSAVGPVARWLPRFELACGLMLLVGVAIIPIALTAAVLLVTFSVAVGLNLARGRRIDCGCSGVVSARRIGWPLAAADVGLAGLAVFAGLASPPVFAVFALGQPESSLSNGDGLALLALAGVLVVGSITASTWRALEAAALGLRRELGGMQ